MSITAKPCQDCGSAAPYEEILIGGIDMAATFPHLCTTCAGVRHKNAIAQERERKIANARANLAAVVPPRLRDTDTSHPDFNLAAWESVGKVDVDDPRNIVLIGRAGVCKSRILALLAKRSALRGKSLAWMPAHDFAMLSDRYKAWKTRADAAEEITRLRYCDRLVFDDLGKEDWNSKIEETFFHVIDHRYSHNRPTWFSCNTHPQHMLLEGRLSRDRGEAIIGRILEGAIIYNITDHRES